MKKWYFWIILAGVWAIAAVVNAVDGRNFFVIGYNLFAAVVFILLAVFQCICDQKGDKGKKIMRYIYFGTLIIVLILLGAVLLFKFLS